MSLTLWVVGRDEQLASGRTWNLVAIVSQHELALALCADSRYFIAPATLNVPLPLAGAWPGLYVPNPRAPQEDALAPIPTAGDADPASGSDGPGQSDAPTEVESGQEGGEVGGVAGGWRAAGAGAPQPARLAEEPA